MFQHILIPVDFSERNRAAVDVARDLAKQNAARLTLIHVIETIEYISVEEMRDFYARLELSARRGLNELSDSLSGQGIPAEKVIVLGKRHDEIVRYAIENKVDLILMNSHRVDPHRPENFGSISYRVAVLSPCAVLLLKQ